MLVMLLVYVLCICEKEKVGTFSLSFFGRNIDFYDILAAPNIICTLKLRYNYYLEGSKVCSISMESS